MTWGRKLNFGQLLFFHILSAKWQIFDLRLWNDLDGFGDENGAQMIT